jgi:integrase/recombinase XerD
LKDGFDVHDYKRRMELAVIKLKENKRVDVDNRIKIFRFRDYAETQGIGLPRRIRYLQNLTKLAAMLGKTEFEKASKDDIERIMLEHGRLDLAEETKALFRVMTKRFYRWLKDPDDEEYPPEVRWIKTTLKNNHKLLPEEILTEQEVMELVKAAEWSRDRAFVAMLYDLGGRAGELLTLQRRNISFDEHGAVALLEGKTGQRRERLILSVPFLSQWLNEHPDTRPEAPLWIHSRQGCHEDGITPMDYYSARRLLQRLRDKTTIKKRVNPQAFRHARATHLANILTEAQMKEYFGWTQGSKMPGRYVHLSGRDVDAALLRAHGLEKKPDQEKPKLTVVKCVRCNLENSTIHSFCSRCGMPLDMKAALELEGARKRADDIMTRLIEDPEVQAVMKRRLKATSKSETT